MYSFSLKKLYFRYILKLLNVRLINVHIICWGGGICFKVVCGWYISENCIEFEFFIFDLSSVVINNEIAIITKMSS